MDTYGKLVDLMSQQIKLLTEALQYYRSEVRDLEKRVIKLESK